MTRTFVRQDTQIRNSDVYSDAIAPTEAAYETSPVNLEEDLTNLRSQLHNLLKVQTGNWWDDLNVPATLETGVKRGVNDLNSGLHAVEKKRVLRDVHSLVDIDVGAAATGTLTSSAQPANDDTVTIGAQTYTFKTTLTGAADEVLLGAAQANSMENLRRAINGDGVAGTNYGVGTATNVDVTATDTGTTVVVTAILGGTGPNSLATTEVGANTSWGGATLSGGVDANFVILGTGELPAQTTAAVGLVTTLGTVVAAHTGTFGTHSLDEVAGGSPIAPLNLALIVDGETRDPILSGGYQIYGLLQGEAGLTDGTTITDATTTRAQLSFVRVNATGDDLEAVPAADIAGKTINYCSRERVRLEDLNEADFLRGAIVDVGLGSGTIDLQTAYANQGSTPVDSTTNVNIDLEGPGITHCWRDDLEQPLFCIIEGSAGGTSEIAVGSDVDIFNVDAVVNDFANGVTVNSDGSSPIAVGVTDGVIESTSGPLTIGGTTDLIFSDGNLAGSTYDTPFNLSDSSAEWDTFESNFGEVSLLNAISQAYAGAIRTKVQAVMTSSVSADTDVNGPSYANNTDVDLAPYNTVTFVDDVEVFVNGILQRNGANAAANEDVYPGTSTAQGDLKFEYNLKGTGSRPDVVTVIVNGQ